MAVLVSISEVYNITDTDSKVDLSLSGINSLIIGDGTNVGDTVLVKMHVTHSLDPSGLNVLGTFGKTQFFHLYRAPSYGFEEDPYPPGFTPGEDVYNGDMNLINYAGFGSPPNTVYTRVSVFRVFLADMAGTWDDEVTRSNIEEFEYEESISCDVSLNLVDSGTETAPEAQDGFIEVSASGGQGVLNYILSSIWGTVNNATGLFENLRPGNYTVTVEDDILVNCNDSIDVILEQASIDPREVFENIIIEVREKCEARAVYLSWENTLGGRSYWLFDNKTDTFENKMRTRSEGEFFNNIDYLDDFTTYNRKTGVEATKSIKLGADKLTADQIQGLEKILYSPDVLMLSSEPDVRPPKWIGVNVRDTTFSVLPENGSIEFEIELPQLFVKRN